MLYRKPLRHREGFRPHLPMLTCSLLALLVGPGVAIRAEPRPQERAQGKRLFRAGAATSNITPPLGEPIVGGWSSPPATHIHDELHARCLVLDDGRTRLAFAVCDNVGIPRPVFDTARRLVHEETGLPEDHLLLAATHTHSATTARSQNPLVPDESLT